MSEDLTAVYAAIDTIIAKNDAKRAANRAFVQTHMPAVSQLFDQLQAAGMKPKLVKLERFT